MSSVDYIRNITPPYLDKKNHGLAKVHLFDDGAVATYKDVQRIKVWTNGALKAQEVTLDGNGLRMCHDNVFAVRGDKKALLRYNLTDHSTSSLHAPSTISNYVILTKYALVLLQDGRVIKAKREFLDSSITNEVAYADQKTKILSLVTTIQVHGSSFLVSDNRSWQLWKYKNDSLRLISHGSVGGVGMTFIQFCKRTVVAITKSGEEILVWKHGMENNPQKLASLATMTSLLVDEAYIVVGCTKATVNVYDMATLQLSAAFRGPLEEDEEGADNQISTASAVSSGKKGPSKSKPLALSFSQFVGAVERRGSYIFGLLDKYILIWSLGTKHVNTPVKVRRTQGKIISKLVVSYDGLLVNVITGRTKKDTFQIDALRWKIDVTSLSKAVAKVEKSTVYERSIGLALGRELTNQLLKDPAFLHRLFKVSLDDTKQADPILATSLIRLAATQKVMPALLSAAIDESISSLGSPNLTTSKVIDLIIISNIKLGEANAQTSKFLQRLAGKKLPITPPKFMFVFKEHDFVTSVVAEFFRFEGRKHLHKTFHRLLSRLVKESSEAWDTDTDRLIRRATKGVTSKTEKKERAGEAKTKSLENTNKLIRWAGLFATAIIGALTSSSLPPLVSETGGRLYAEIKTAVQDAPDETLLQLGPVNIIICKFYVQAIQAPSFFDILGPVSMDVQFNLAGIGGLIEDTVLGKLDPAHPFAAAYKAPLLGAIKIACSDKKKQVVSSSPKVFAVKVNGPFIHKDYHNAAEFILSNAHAIAEINSTSQYVLNTQSEAILKQLVNTEIAVKSKEQCKFFCVPHADETEWPADAVITEFTARAVPGDPKEDFDSIITTEHIPFSSLLTVPPPACKDLRDWLGKEIEHHSFTVVVFFRGSWCPFCALGMKSWNKYLPSIVARDGMIVGVSSMSQTASKKTAARWEVAYPFLGDPENELASQYHLDIDVSRKDYAHGMAQPGVIVLSRQGEVLFFWRSLSTLSNAFGGIGRPKPFKVLVQVINSLKNRSFDEMDSGDSFTQLTTSMSDSMAGS